VKQPKVKFRLKGILEYLEITTILAISLKPDSMLSITIKNATMSKTLCRVVYILSTAN
jgi:hypothetical protein